MRMYKTFKDLFINATAFKSSFESHYSTPTELFSNSNWFMSLDNLFIEIYNIFLSRSYNKYFIWESLDNSDDELNTGINGQFFPTFFDSLLQYYKNQLVLLNNDINDLKNWEDRSNQTVSRGTGANSSYSQPTPLGHKWDDNVDAPTAKSIADNTTTMYNKPNDLGQYMKFEFRTYWNNIFNKFEKFFINKSFVDGWC